MEGTKWLKYCMCVNGGCNRLKRRKLVVTLSCIRRKKNLYQETFISLLARHVTYIVKTQKKTILSKTVLDYLHILELCIVCWSKMNWTSCHIIINTIPAYQLILVLRLRCGTKSIPNVMEKRCIQLFSDCIIIDKIRQYKKAITSF